MTNEHLRLMLDDPCDFGLLHQAALRFANAAVPAPVLAAARLGRIVALRKPTGRLRALVVGDVFRRLVARALARHFAAALQDACMPYQFGLSTRAALYKLLQVAIECNPVATLYGNLADALWDQLNQGKTRVWNAAGEEPPNLAALQPDPSSAADVWVGACLDPATRAPRARCARRAPRD